MDRAAVMGFPLLVRSLRLAIELIDLRIEHAARTFGATITFAGNIEGVTRTPLVAIYTYTQIPGGDEPAMRLVLISVVLAVLAMGMSELFARRVKRTMGLSA